VAAPMPVAPPTTSARLPSYRKASNWLMTDVLLVSGDHAANAEVDDRIHVEAELAEDLVAVLVELGCPAGQRRLFVVLHGRGHEPERVAVGRLAVLHVAVGDRLGVDGHLERGMHDRPLPAEVLEPL